MTTRSRAAAVTGGGEDSVFFSYNNILSLLAVWRLYFHFIPFRFFFSPLSFHVYYKDIARVESERVRTTITSSRQLKLSAILHFYVYSLLPAQMASSSLEEEVSFGIRYAANKSMAIWKPDCRANEQFRSGSLIIFCFYCHRKLRLSAILYFSHSVQLSRLQEMCGVAQLYIKMYRITIKTRKGERDGEVKVNWN